ncbi:4'-phosphopantetheinyl transferase superfamily protein [Mesomycoplasma neurolyticum]|uniref:Holo-[acyl-carrier protein]synthase n=1 Tax=Mesomycoplasma neurolyticum TaxID=2120 RepID=A0A449A654_9BACT|nr:4'-phosphopantetheinyl transferase superfamily protein [Mesomycoplasma neurolyticum]VEU59714.1 Holo-[acyl-carrier protein]synthase [Mesomycoplasma neurolyticum]
MLGIDITNIARFRNISLKTIKRFLSEEEFLIYQNEENKIKFLAVRWAIKEAIFKADNLEYSFKKINIKKTKGKYIYKNFVISTSCEENLLTAIALKKEN